MLFRRQSLCPLRLHYLPRPAVLPLSRGVLTTAMGRCEWTSALVLPYQRRLREVNEAMLATYLVGGNTRRLRGALANLLKAARSPAAASRASRGGRSAGS